MKTKQIAILSVAILLISMLFASCGPQRKFEKVDPNATTTETTTETTTQPPFLEDDPNEEKFTFAVGIQMGMGIREVQDLIGVHVKTKMVDGRKNLAVEFSGVFINNTTEKNVQFMFDQRSEKLEQMQFQCNTDTDGANATGAVTLFDLRYGKSAITYGKYENHIWYNGGVFIMLSVVDEDNYVVTYTEKEYFIKTRAEEYKIFKEEMMDSKKPVTTK